MVIDEAAGRDELLNPPADAPEEQADAAQQQTEPSPADEPTQNVSEQTGSESGIPPEEGSAGVEDIQDEFEAYEGHAEPLELVEEKSEEENLDLRWYILKVASNRENSIADALRRRVKVEGVESFFGEIIVPTEDVAEFKNGKKRVVKRKLYPGYICVQMHITDDTWFLVRDTPGIGDFTGAAGRPTPMLDHEVERILPKKKGADEDEGKVKIGIPFKVDDRVRIKEGTFENFEGRVEAIDEANGRVTVEINIFDRPTPVEIDHWQLESV